MGIVFHLTDILRLVINFGIIINESINQHQQ